MELYTLLCEWSFCMWNFINSQAMERFPLLKEKDEAIISIEEENPSWAATKGILNSVTKLWKLCMVDPLHEEVSVKAKFKFGLHASYFTLNFWLQISALFPPYLQIFICSNSQLPANQCLLWRYIPPWREWKLSPGIFSVDALVVRAWKPWWWKLVLHVENLRWDISGAIKNSQN